jgi:hypothetical protein
MHQFDHLTNTEEPKKRGKTKTKTKNEHTKIAKHGQQHIFLLCRASLRR